MTSAKRLPRRSMVRALPSMTASMRRVPSATDRRVVRVELTPAGRDAFDQQAAPHEARVDALFAGLGAADLDLLDDLLHRLEGGLHPEGNRTT